MHYRLGEYDVLWEVSNDILAEMLDALRNRSPYVNGAIMHGASHPITAGPLGDSYSFQVLAFTALYHVASRRPEILTERRRSAHL